MGKVCFGAGGPSPGNRALGVLGDVFGGEGLRGESRPSPLLPKGGALFKISRGGNVAWRGVGGRVSPLVSGLGAGQGSGCALEGAGEGVESPGVFKQGVAWPDKLFDAANIATFAPEDKIKYEYAMTTERDIRNQIRYAEKQGIEQGIEQGKEQKAIEIARNLLGLGVDVDTIVKSSGLTKEQVNALKTV